MTEQGEFFTTLLYMLICVTSEHFLDFKGSLVYFHLYWSCVFLLLEIFWEKQISKFLYKLILLFYQLEGKSRKLPVVLISTCVGTELLRCSLGFYVFYSV